MKGKLLKAARSFAVLMLLHALAFSTMLQTEEMGIAAVSDAAIAVDVIVNIDKDTRPKP